MPARYAIVWGFVEVSQAMEYGALVSVATRTPSTYSSTRATLTSSAAVICTVAVPLAVLPLAGLVMLAVGGVVSPGAVIAWTTASWALMRP